MGYCIYINPSTQASEDASEHYNYFRDYDPGIGRYVESDLIGLRGGLNTYGYVRQTPLTRLDPFGLFSIGKSCCGQNTTLTQQVSNACKVVTTNIRDPKLRACLLRQCEQGEISCDGFVCRNTDWVGWSTIFSGAINLCIKTNYWVGVAGDWGCVAIHEWAHKCGWHHDAGGGGGVPGSEGPYNYDSCRSWSPPRTGPPNVR